MANKTYRLNFGMSDGTTKSVDFAVAYDDSGDIPAYWQAELDAGVEAINGAMESAGRNKSAFLWYHDAHWTNNSRMSPRLLRYLCEHTDMRKVNFGGDIVSTETAESRADWAYLYDWRDAIRGLPNHHSVRGNHEDDIPGLQTDKAVYSFLMAAEESNDIVRGGDFYYYRDDISEKTRYLYLDTHMCTTLTNQGEPLAVQFAVEALNSTPEGWHIVPIAHIWFLYADWNTPKVGSIPDYCQQLLDLFDAYNSRTSGSVTVDGTAVSYNFAGAVGKVEFCIGGHTHVDMDFTSTGGIPVILTEADQYEWRGGYDATQGTTGESSVNGIIADYDAKKVSVVRIGRGSGRTVSLTDTETGTAYTNVLEEAGYVADKRLSQSGGYSEADQSGVYLTGYIPLNIGDTLYFKNMTLTKTFNTGYDQHLYFFDSSKVGYTHDHVSDLDDAYTGVVSAVWDDNSNLQQLTFKGGTLDGVTYISGYVRINAVYIDSNSIITVNEPIA